MTNEDNFRHLMHIIVEGLTDENVKSIRYLCQEAIPHGKQFPNAHAFLDHFESKGLIFHGDLFFLAEVLYRINRHDLLKKLPGVKNRKEYEKNFLSFQHTQNFTPYRVACFQLVEELTEADFTNLKSLCKSRLSTRNYNKSTDVLSLLVCLEEEDLMCEDDLQFIIEILSRLDNQVPFRTFKRLQEGDTTITLPKCHQHTPLFQSQSYSGHNADKAFGPQSHSNTYPDMAFHNEQNPNMGSLHGQNPGNFPRQQSNPAWLDVHQSKGSQHGENSAYDRVFDPEFNPASKAFTPPQYPEDSCCHGSTNNPEDSQPLGFQSQLSAEESHRDNEDSKTYLKQPSLGEYQNSQNRSPSEHEEISLQENVSMTRHPPASTCLEEDIQDPHQQGGDQEDPEVNSDSSFLNQMRDRIEHPKAQEETVNPNSTTTSLGRYKMDRNPVGICLIINNEEFESTVNIAEAQRRLELEGNEYQMPNCTLKNREGSSKDVERIESLFTKFRFVCKRFENLDKKALAKVVLEHAQLDHSDYDCFVCFILTHGSDGLVYGVDGLTLSVAKLAKAFRPNLCSSLIDKPKLFFIQACQGYNSMGGHQGHFRECENDIQADSPMTEMQAQTPVEADFLISHSTVPGYLSYRSITNGSWFIDSLIDNLDKYCKDEDLMSILTKVNEEVAKKPLKQMPMPALTLRKKIFFTKHD